MTRFLQVAAVVAAGTLVGVVVPTPAAAVECSPANGAPFPYLPWSQERLNPQRVWPLARGKHVTVAVIDSGTSSSHAQLSGKVLPGADLTVSGNRPANNDCAGHGTMVGGIIAARESSKSGFAGIAPDATILPIRIANDTKRFEGGSALVAKAIRYAVANHADVVNLSLTTDPSADLQAAVREALDSDVVVVAAAGNDAQKNNPVTYPASYPGVLAVASVDRDGKRAENSEVGQFVGVAAPGVEIVAPARTSGYVTDSGTSFAAPFVAGTAALIRSYYPKMSAAAVVQRIKSTADRPGNGPNTAVGYGVVNPYRAVADLVGSAGTAPEDTKAIPPAGSADDSGRTLRIVALVVFGFCVALTVLVLVGAAVLPRARRRGWQAAQPPSAARRTG